MDDKHFQDVPRSIQLENLDQALPPFRSRDGKERKSQPPERLLFDRVSVEGSS